MLPSYNFALADQIFKQAAAITPLFVKMQRVATSRQIEFPMPAQMFPYGLVVQPHDVVNAMAIGGSSINKHFPPSTDVRPKGVHMFLTDTGDVVVDNISATRTVERLSDVRPTYIAGTFTAKDLEDVLRSLDDIHAKLRDFRMAYGNWAPVQWVVDHLANH
jgi:hypothetical protein